MIRALWTASTGMQALQMSVDNIANNLANVNTTGFKKSHMNFEDLMYVHLRAAGTNAAANVIVPTGIQIGHGTKLVATQKIFSQGNFEQTENPLDLCIQGTGFFQITLPDGSVAYTRDGSFKLDANGQIVTSNGYIFDAGFTIDPDATEITIAEDGTITQVVNDTPTVVGQIQLYKFVNPAGLKAIGNNLFKETDASGTATAGTPGENGMGTILQGFLESSNVKVVEEMVKLIESQRAYEINSRSIQTADAMLQTVNTLKR